MSRLTEMILGILGGLLGFGGAFLALFIGTVDEVVSGSSEISSLGVSAFLFSALAIIGAIVVKFKAKLGGGLMLISGIAILVSISLFGVIPALFLIPAGLMGILRKSKNPNVAV
ncbi:hypothetical protein [Cytobacillus sp. IB215665]|uniref:hypothetical protein n=1 Tax=Cytobacillus sp. IB215665 TaxID=3097357 RepID=UPI002A0F4D17|nr:hypothetical protein [Cytobacillus sp. IB215665]MDX8363774.1 hypothetical protein [Cytobacillus sp. IB215665]